MEEVLDEARIVFSLMQQKNEEFVNVAKRLEKIEIKLHKEEDEISKKKSLEALKNRIEETNEVLNEIELDIHKHIKSLKKAETKKFPFFVVSVVVSIVSTMLTTTFFLILDLQGVGLIDFFLDLYKNF